MNDRPTGKTRETPGFMIYTGSRSLFEELEPESVKRLLLGMIDYASEGREPEPENAEERIAWAALRDKMSWDKRRYEDRCLQNQYNRFLREAEKGFRREDCPDFEAWLELSERGTRKIADTLALFYDRNHFLRNQPNKNPDPYPEKNKNPYPEKNINPYPDPVPVRGPQSDPGENTRAGVRSGSRVFVPLRPYI